MMFVHRILGCLTSFGEALTILIVSFFDEKIAVRTMTISSGAGQQCRDEDESSLATSRSHTLFRLWPAHLLW